MWYLEYCVGSGSERIEFVVSIIVGEIECFSTFFTGVIVVDVYADFPSCHTFFSYIFYSILIRIIIDVSWYISSIGLWSLYEGEGSSFVSFSVSELVYSIEVEGIVTDSVYEEGSRIGDIDEGSCICTESIVDGIYSDSRWIIW